MHRITRFSLAHPGVTLLALGAITIVLCSGLPRLRSEFGYRVLVGDDHPAIRTLDQFIERFGVGLPVEILWSCGPDQPCLTVFDRTSLEMADAVTQALLPLPGVRDVRGVANAPILFPLPDGFSARTFVDNGIPVSDTEQLAARVLQDPLWVGSLVSPNGLVGVIRVEPTDNEPQTDLQVVDAIQDALRPFEEAGFDYHLVGDAVGAVIAGRELAKSTARLIPVTVLVIALVLLALTRSLRATVVALVTMGTALLWAFGILGWFNWPRDGILQVLAPLILVIGVCDAVHLLSRYTIGISSAEDSESTTARGRVLIAVSQDVGPACLLTTLTTAAAFLSFTTSALDTFVRFGFTSAFAVMACLFLTFSLLPILTRLFVGASPGIRRATAAWDSTLRSVVEISERRSIPILFASGALLLVFGFGWLSYLRVDTDFNESFGERSRVVRWIRFMEANLRPTETLEVEASLPRGITFASPRTLETVSDFSEFLSNVDGLGKTRSVVDVIARVNRLLHDDKPEYERPAETARGNAEILELIGFEEQGVLSNWLTFDHSRLRISVEAPESSNANYETALSVVREHVALALPDWEILLTGGIAIEHDWIKAVQGTQTRSFPIAFFLVFVFVALFLRSIRLALAAMVPTLLPVVVTMGSMAWLGMSLDVGRAMIAAILIGIAVDDAIHLLSQYQRRRKTGDNPRVAMREAVQHVGGAVVTTSLALSLGFLTLVASSWQTISSFGFFVSLAILAALAAALLVLPALVFAFSRMQTSR